MTVKKNIIVCLLVWLALAAIPQAAIGSNRFHTALLKQIAAKTKVTSLVDTLSTGEHILPVAFRKQVLVAIVESGQVTHIGYAFFSPEQRAAYGKELCNFIERYYLELDIPTNEHISAAQRMKEDRVSISHRHLSASGMRALCADTTVRVHLTVTGDKGYTFQWLKNDKEVQAISFPIEYDLLIGTEMEERENTLIDEARSHVCGNEGRTTPEKDKMVKAWKDNYYTDKGGSYLLDILACNQYYELDDKGKVCPIYNRTYLVESLYNLFTTNLIENDFTIDISVRKYGFKHEIVSVPLQQWVSYYLKAGCKPYFGIIRQDDEQVECELFMHNSVLGYNHIMNIVFPTKQLEAKGGHIKARLLCYVNTSRITNIFDDSNPKRK